MSIYYISIINIYATYYTPILKGHAASAFPPAIFVQIVTQLGSTTARLHITGRKCAVLRVFIPETLLIVGYNIYILHVWYSNYLDICTIWQCNYTLLFWFFDGIHLHATHDYVQLLWHLEVLTQCSRLWISSYYSFQWLLANHIAHIINYIYHRNLTRCSPCFTSLMISASLSYQLARATWLMRVSMTTLQIRNWI
jgi:hypothetical protein